MFVVVAWGVYRLTCRLAGPVSLLDGGGGVGGGGMPGAPRGSLWNEAYSEKTSLLREEAVNADARGGFDKLGESFRSGRSYYIPPSGVV